MKPRTASPTSPLTPAQGRLCILLTALLWSLNGFFAKVLTQPSWFALNEPEVRPLQIAFFRVFFAGAFLVPLLRRAELTVKPLMLGMALCFAVMNGLFLSAMVLGKAANAILLQYTAPLWLYLFSLCLPRERTDPRGRAALVIGMGGIAVILAGGWGDENMFTLLLGLGGGVTYAGVLFLLRELRSVSATWLTVWNHLCAALLLAPLGLWAGIPTGRQLIALFLFGAVQLGFPYFLMTRALRTINPQEAATITLLEPLLSSLWAYLVSPETDTPPPLTLVGGALILGSLAWRYWPWRRARGVNSSLPRAVGEGPPLTDASPAGDK